MGEITVLLVGSVPETMLAGLRPGAPKEDRSRWPLPEGGPQELPVQEGHTSPSVRWTPFRCSLPTPSRFLAPDGTLRVDLLLADRTWPSAAMSRALERPVLIVTDRGLSTRECRSVLGLSARRRGMAAVSIQGLEGDPRRLRNLALHELGHLRGWRHCTTSGCLMTPVTTPADLDSRDDFLCRDCAKEKHVTCNRCSRKGGSWFPGKVGQIGFRSPGARKHSQADPSCVSTSQEDCP